MENNGFEALAAFVVSGCAMLAALIPAPKPTSSVLWKALHAIVNFAAMNFWHAKNRDPADEAAEAKKK